MNIRQLSKLARELIPGSNGLLSKRAEMFAPGIWPEFFDRAEGIYVTDIESNVYRDLSHFSVGTCTLGYQHPDVDAAVIDAIKKGTMSTLNCPEEVQLASKLTQLHPWAQMARFARSGGEANAIAVRIARAYTEKDKIAFCGYHGWHDWYLAANLRNESNLDQVLMEGLSTRGVPSNLEGSVVPFLWGDIGALEEILASGGVAAIKMEVMRNFEPTKTYLQQVRALANEYGALLIFDECTSGFRATLGGLHLKYGIFPDLCVLGKTIGNGYPITAVIGSRDVMSESQTTFISSTFFTERVGFVAALKAIEVMEKEKSWEYITEMGKYFRQKLTACLKAHGWSVAFSGMAALTNYVIAANDYAKVKTFLTQEMLKRGFLMSNLFYPSIAHKKNDVDDFMSALDSIISEINGDEAKIILDGPVCHSGFSRLN